VEAVALALGGDLREGLSEAEARDRLERLGPNRLARPERPDYLGLAARQFADPLVALLVAAAIVSAGIGEVVEAAVIAAIVVLNAVLGFVQESGAERALVALREQFTHTAWVVRDGRERELAVDELVVGDLVVLREGDRVPADARLSGAERLAVTEAALTGESLPVEKSSAPAPAASPLADRTSMVYAATAVTRGRGTAVVTATGPDTEVGRIAALSERAERPPTPLQRRLGALARLLVVVGVAITVVLAALLVARGEPAREAFLVGVSVAVAAVPEGLAATVTIALALGAHAMAQRGAIVRRLAAVETFGRTTAVCADKTGTLTENRLALDQAVPAPGRDAQDVIRAGALASSATLVDGGGGALQGVGDPVDAALVLAATEGLGPDGLRSAGRRVGERPFDPATRRMTVVYETDAGRRAYVSSTPDSPAEPTAKRHGAPPLPKEEEPPNRPTPKNERSEERGCER
jgi:magnesium-transporting ATPase (P-type)